MAVADLLAATHGSARSVADHNQHARGGRLVDNVEGHPSCVRPRAAFAFIPRQHSGAVLSAQATLTFGAYQPHLPRGRSPAVLLGHGNTQPFRGLGKQRVCRRAFTDLHLVLGSGSGGYSTVVISASRLHALATSAPRSSGAPGLAPSGTLVVLDVALTCRRTGDVVALVLVTENLMPSANVECLRFSLYRTVAQLQLLAKTRFLGASDQQSSPGEHAATGGTALQHASA